MSCKVTTSLNTDGIVEMKNGLKLYTGTGNFSGTDGSVVIYHPFDSILSASATPLAAAAVGGGDQLTIEPSATVAANHVAHNSDGSLTPYTGKQCYVSREDAAGGTSGLAFSVLMIGR